MKPAELKKEYIRLRAEGKSYNFIAEELHISKSTCAAWEKELAAQIDELKRAQLEELCESYGMAKEARIKRLGGTLEKIDEALDKTDFSTIDAAKLLDYKLKYAEALKGEYVRTTPALELENIDGERIMAAFGDLLNRVRAGDVTTEQAQKESLILSQLLKAHYTVNIQSKLEILETILEGRK